VLFGPKASTGSPAASIAVSGPVAPVAIVSPGSTWFFQVLPPSKLVYAQPVLSLRCSRSTKTR
jgi:hypothetical protein